MFSATDTEGNEKAAFLNQLKQDTISSVDCSEKGLTGDDLPALTEIIKEKGNITELDLKFISIGLAGIESLKELILQTKGLQKLNLRLTDLGNNGVLSLIYDSRLESLIKNIDFDFSTNNINEEGLSKAKVATEKKILSPNSLLTMLAGNPIYNESLVNECRELAKLLKKEKASTMNIEANKKSVVNTSSNMFAKYEEEKEQDLPKDLKMQLGTIRNQLGQDRRLVNAAVRFISQGQAVLLDETQKFTH